MEDIVGTILTAGIVFLCLAIVGLLATVVLLAQKYKWKVVVKELASGRKIVRYTKAAEIKTNGVSMLRILKYKKIPCPMPPSEAIEVDIKGRKCIEVYLTPEGQFVFSKDGITITQEGSIGKYVDDVCTVEYIETKKGLVLKEEFDKLNEEQKLEFFNDKKMPKQLKIVTQEFKTSKWLFIKDENHCVAAIQPYTTNQRVLLVDQHDKAKADSGFDINAWIMPIVGVLGIVMLLVVAMMIFDSYQEHQVKMQDSQLAIAEKLNSAAGGLSGVAGDIQQIKNEVLGRPTNRGETPN